MIRDELRERYGEFCAQAERYFDKENLAMIYDALELATDKMEGQWRYDHSPMMDHAVRTAQIVMGEIGLGRNSTISTLVHDVVRLQLLPVEEMGRRYGDQVVTILKGLCNISEVDPKISQEQADNFRELIVSYSTDPRVILIKLADRLEVMRSMEMFPAEKQVKKSWESLNLYAQIAHKLGLYEIKGELETTALKYLEPEAYNDIVTRLERTAPERERFALSFLEPIRSRMDALGIKYQIKGRTKSVYSIWNKMRKMKIPFEEVFDILAIRIIIDCEQEQEKTLCWNIYSIITDYYTPNPDRLRDWISIPRSNGYESLHTTVVTPEGRWVEIQIRSERMDLVAERGIAAHWRYKGLVKGGMGSEQWLAKLRELMETTETSTIATRFDAKITSEEVFVFTPTGDLRKLPEGATILDFAFDIHSSLGSTCTGGRVNGRNVSIREQLKNGDIVEILTSKNQRPKPDWLGFVATGKARNRIKAYLREAQAKASVLGREELERKMKNWKLAMPIDEAVTMLCKHFKLKTGTELYGKIVDQSVDLAQIKLILTQEAGEPIIQKPRKAVDDHRKEEGPGGDVLVIEDNLRGIEYKLARCCNPIRGDKVFGFITVGSGITIHREECPNAARLREMYPYRVISARWREASQEGGAFQISVRIVADDATGMVNNINDVITKELRLNIRSMSLASASGVLSGLINIEVTGSGIADTIIHTLLRLKGVQKAYRVN